MANKTFYPSFTYGFARVYMEFTVTASNPATNAPLISTVVGVDQTCLTSITRTGTGVNVFLLGARDNYANLIYATADVEGTTGQWASIGTVINEGSSTAGIGFTVFSWAAGGSAADVIAGKKLRICLVFKNSATSNPA